MRSKRRANGLNPPEPRPFETDPFRLVNEIATSFVQGLIKPLRPYGSRGTSASPEWTRACANPSGRDMRHEAIVAERELLPRDPRVEGEFAVRVRCQAGDIDAQIINLSSDGFRLYSDNPLQAGWVVTLEAAKQFPVKALICWACGNDSGGVFAEPVAL